MRRRHRPQHCPICRAHFDATSSPYNPGAEPKPGDFSVCFYCGAVLRFGGGGRLRRAYVAELHQVGEDDPELFDKIGQLQNAVFAARRERAAN